MTSPLRRLARHFTLFYAYGRRMRLYGGTVDSFIDGKATAQLGHARTMILRTDDGDMVVGFIPRGQTRRAVMWANQFNRKAGRRIHA